MAKKSNKEPPPVLGAGEEVKNWWGKILKGSPLRSARAVARWTGMGLWVYVGIHLRTPEYMRKFRLKTIGNLARAGVIRKAIKTSDYDNVPSIKDRKEVPLSVPADSILLLGKR